MTPTVLGLNALLADMEPMLLRLLGTNIDIAYRQTAGLWSVQVAAGRLEEVLLTLSVEACEAMESKGGVLLVETANRHNPDGLAPGDYVVLSVSDTVRSVTHGVRAAVQGRDRREGLGIRLGIELAETLGGRLDLVPLTGRGLSVQLLLPRAPGAAPKVPMDKEQLQAHGETIMIVEDNEMMMSATHRSLTRLGYGVLMAHSAEAALTLLDAHDGPLDLLLTDIILPRMDGLQLARLARQKRPNLRVVQMSGFSGEALRRKDAVEPDAPLLEKPFTFDGLARAIRQALS